MQILTRRKLINIRNRLRSLHPSDIRAILAFWLFGLINNVLYVVILSSALDLVGGDVPKGVVLLADVVPGFLTKLIAPYFIERVRYATRVWFLAGLSAGGMLVISLTPAATDSASISIKLVGVALASLSSGGGELSFLALTHFYGQKSLAAWSSGTGGAGLVGAWLYLLSTSTFGLSSSTTLLACSFFPLVMLGSYFFLLPGFEETGRAGYTTIGDEEDDNGSNPDHASLLQPPAVSQMQPSKAGLQQNLTRARALFLPYMLPLLLVYVAEYTINQGVAPTLLFPLPTTPFHSFREFYPTYNALYQVGVFISRSSTPFIRIHNLYLPSMLQVVNLLVLIIHAMFDYIPSVWIVFLIVFWEGLLGGGVYVNTFSEITDRVAEEDREFSLAATTVSDSGGIVIAAFVGMALEKGLCGFQVKHGRDSCRQT